MSGSNEQQKSAGALVYLVEELGDARMRCDQLLRYVDKATKLIEKSAQKDHLFEVAGDVIQGIPETTFKLHKALQAVALAANRIDYEEIKQDLRPEKTEELERVLKDVRIRQVHRRSSPMLNPEGVVTQLRGLAKKAREDGVLATADLASLIQSLEAGGPKVAEDRGAKIAAEFEAMAQALENPPAGELPSRVRLAGVLRRTLGGHMELRTADSEALQSGWFKSPEEEVTAELTTAISAIKKMVQGLNNPRRNRTMFMSALGCLSRAANALGQDPAIAEALDRASNILFRKWSTTKSPVSESVPLAARMASSEDEKLSRFEEGKSADPTKKMSPEDAKEWKENTEEHKDKFKKDAAKPPEEAVSEITAAIEALKKLSRGSGNPKRLMVSVLSDLSLAMQKMGQNEKISNLLDRTAAVVQASWSLKGLKEMGATDEGEIDKTAFVAPEPQNPEEVTRVIAQMMDAARKATTLDGDYKRVLFQAVRIINGLYGLGLQFEVPSIGLLVRVQKELMKFAGVHPAMTTYASEDEKRSRFEEGKSADPTKKMSPEDAKEWKENTEEHKDKFKSAKRREVTSGSDRSWKAA